MKQSDNALKFLKSKMKCKKRNYNILRNRLINEIRKEKANVYEQGKGNSKLIWENLRNLTGNIKKNQ